MKKQHTKSNRTIPPNKKLDLLLKILIPLFFVSGVTIFSYPFVSDILNNFHDQFVINEYQKEFTKLNKTQKKVRLEEMEEQNKKLVANYKVTNVPGMGLVKNPLDSILKSTQAPTKEYFQKHMVGAIFIPKINVSLPIFDETNAELLEQGVTVLQGTSFPVGGKGTHSVLSGHNGLADKKLFTDLEKLEKGNMFYIEIAGQKLAYRVEKFQTVLPTELESLKIEDNLDQVTLLTCTPYMVNTHRLLVTGLRVPYAEKSVEQQVKSINHYHIYRMVALTILMFFIFLMFIYRMWRIIVYRRSQKRNYDFTFYVKENQKALVGITYYLSQDIKKQARANMANYSAVSDQNGCVNFGHIPGGKYFVSTHYDNSHPKVVGYIRHLNDNLFSIKLKKHRIFSKKNKKYTIHKKKD